jgi:hypothetical protein
MSSAIISITNSSWAIDRQQLEWIAALESGKVLHFKNLPFEIHENEKSLFSESIQNPKSRNISLGSDGELKGALGDPTSLITLKEMILRFRNLSQILVHSLVPKYAEYLKVSPTSFRPLNISNRKQSWRADDRRLHVDAFATRPNYGERILRVFMNINPNSQPRVWRVGDSFENIVEQFLPKIKAYSYFQAKFLNVVGLTKSFRSEYDHMMLQIHDAMKSDLDYQKNSPQAQFNFMPGDVWVCFSDQTSHAAMSGQYMMEQTYNLPLKALYDAQSSPLAILTSKVQRKLV